jgi:hypothetical protein
MSDRDGGDGKEKKQETPKMARSLVTDVGNNVSL